MSSGTMGCLTGNKPRSAASISIPYIDAYRGRSEVSFPLRWLLGSSVQKLAACTSPIFLFFHFPLGKDIEPLGEWRTYLPVFREYIGRGCVAKMMSIL